MYKLCIIGLSIIFILSINGVWSRSVCGHLEGSWVFIEDPTRMERLFASRADYDERIAELRHTVESEVTPVTPFQVVWYPDFRHPAGGAFNPYSHYIVLVLHMFEGNELSLVDTLVEAKYMDQLGMLFCKKSNGKCGRDYKGQVSYVEDGDEVGIYIIPEDSASLVVHYFINDVLTGDPVKLKLKSFKTLFPAVTFTKPGLVTIKECGEEPPLRLLKEIEFMAGKRPLMSYESLIRYYKSEKPNYTGVHNLRKHEGMWTFRDIFIACKTPEDQCRVPKLTKSKNSRFIVDVFITELGARKIKFLYLFRFARSFATYIHRDLVKNTWGKFGPTTETTKLFGPSDVRVLQHWMNQFLVSATMLFLGPNGKSLHIANNNCAITLKKRNKHRAKPLLD